MKYVRRVLIVLAVLILCGIGTTCGIYLKGYEKVHITGTEVKRFDTKTKEGQMSSDVRLIYAQTLDGKTRVYKNVDTGWWPPYLKFDSGDIAGDATNFAQDDTKPVVLVTYYGIRSPMFSWYPNVLDLKLVSEDHQVWPIFNIFILTLLAAFLIFVALGIRRLSRWRPFGGKEEVAVGPNDESLEDE